jgi:hypothetical protein
MDSDRITHSVDRKWEFGIDGNLTSSSFGLGELGLCTELGYRERAMPHISSM